MAGQRNAIDGRIVEIAAEMERDELCGATGARSVAALVAWKLAASSANAHTITTVARRLEEFPRCAQGMREGRLSLDQVGVIAARAGQGSDEHYAAAGRVRHGQPAAHRGQPANRDPNPSPSREPDRGRRSPRPPMNSSAVGGSNFRTWTRRSSTRRWRLIVMRFSPQWKRDHDDDERAVENRPPLPTTGEAFMRLVEAGWDTEAARRPHGQHTTVVVHVDVAQTRRRTASGPAAHRRRTPVPDL